MAPQRLASPLRELKSHYDVVVIGSGYGGAVAAARIAETRAGLRDAKDGPSICVLERGHEYQPGEYPHTLARIVRNTQLHLKRGRVGARHALYDLRMFEDISVFKGCGLGGTSLINAGVVIEPRPEVLASGDWPVAITADELENDFDLARTMLDPHVYPRPLGPGSSTMPSPWPDLPKLARLRESALAGTRAEAAEIAVSFRDYNNDAGINLHACTLCGDCVTGCNFGAKQTLITNYLPQARRFGARLFTGLDVRWLERRFWKSRGREVWLVHCRKSESLIADAQASETFVAADVVVLAAGSLGSTEILLRSRERGLAVSGQLGKRFSGNGDAIAFAYNTDREIRGVGIGYSAPADVNPPGPTIVGNLDLRTPPQGEILIQEGAIPSGLKTLARFALPLSALATGGETDRSIGDILKRWFRGVVSIVFGAYEGAVNRTLTLLVMGHDGADGAMHLSKDRLNVSWPKGEALVTIERSRRYLAELARRLGGRHIVSVFWGRMFGDRLLTVHPLGGCAMGEDSARGVVNDRGQVFDGQFRKSAYDSLYVADGAIIPRSVGANPLLLIAALAERISRKLIALHGDSWFREGRNPALADEAPPVERARPITRTISVQFSERMRGWYRPLTAPEDKRQTLELAMDIAWDDIKDLKSLSREDNTEEDPDGALRHSSVKLPATILGTVWAPALSRTPLSAHGTFKLFVPDRNRVETRRMEYQLSLTSRDGERYLLEGAKIIRDSPSTGKLWAELTTLPYSVRAESAAGPVIGSGVVRLKWWEVFLNVWKIRVSGARTVAERWGAVLRILAFYGTTIYKQFAWPFATSDMLDAFRRKPSLPERPNKPGLTVTEVRTVTVVTGDGADIELTRIRGGGRGPVIVAPGYGTSTYCFRLPTIRRNITEYLTAKGYDVWLLDYRSSERSAASVTQFTVDHIARYDWPAAVRHVMRETSGTGPPIRPQVLAHCLGSATAFMSLLGGWLVDDFGRPLIRSQISNQMFTHFDQGPVNRVRSFLPSAHLMWMLGWWPSPPNVAPHSFDPEVDTRSPFMPRVWDRLLHFYPTEERCRNPVCRRIHFLYGDVFRHDQLNADTHDATYDLWSRTNAHVFYQLQRMVARNRVVDEKGRDTYLTHENAARLRLPITLLQGMKNTFFRPAGADITLNWLRNHGPSDLPKDELYRLVRLEGYGHNDTFIGRDADLDVFPVILAELERGDDAARRLQLI